MGHSGNSLRDLAMLALERELVENVREIHGLCIISIDGEEVKLGKEQAETFLRAILKVTDRERRSASR